MIDGAALMTLGYVIVVKALDGGPGRCFLRKAVGLSREETGLSLAYHLTGRGR
jgi:hypothetical protein